MALYPQFSTYGAPPMGERMDPRPLPDKAAAPVRVRIVLTQGARTHILQAGLTKRLNTLMERADTLGGVLMVGDRIGLSESSRHDLIVLRRRVVIEPADNVLELVLDVPATRI